MTRFQYQLFVEQHTRCRGGAPLHRWALAMKYTRPSTVLRLLAVPALWLCSAALAPAMASTITTATLSAGHSHACAIDKAGQARCWGSNADGELGDGSRTDRDGPVAVQGLPASVAVAAVQAGRGFSCALLQDQSVHCWGRITGSVVAQAMQDVPPALQLSAGSSHACALAVSGYAYCWGDSSRGQRGGGSSSPLPPGQITPITTLQSRSVSKVVAGGDATCTLQGGTGQVLCVGTADWLPASPAGPEMVRLLPAMGDDVLDMAAHEGHACILRRTGAVACWGRNESGQVGTAASAALVPAPVDVAVLQQQPALSISVGAGVSCAVQSTRAIRCWGAQGLLGAGNDKNPRWGGQVVGIEDATRVSAGGTHACAVLQGGYVQCWGDNAHGQLGGAGLCNAHLALYLNYQDYSPRFNFGPCVPYSAGITPHEVKGFDVRADADRWMDWAEVALSGSLQWGLDRSFDTQEGYYHRTYPGDRSLAVSTNGTPHVFYRGPETGGAWSVLGRLSHWMGQVN